MLRPALSVRRMHSTPIGPTGAAIDKPSSSPRSTKIVSITILLYGTDRLLCYPAADGTGLRNPPERRLRLLAVLQVLIDRGAVALGLPAGRQPAAGGAAGARTRPGPLPRLVGGFAS